MPFSVMRSKLLEVPLCGTIFSTLPGVTAIAAPAIASATNPVNACLMQTPC